MKEKGSLGLAAVLVMISVLVSGCVWGPTYPCPDCGCHYNNTYLDTSEYATLALNASEWQYIGKFTTARVQLRYEDHYGKYWAWDLRYDQEVPSLDNDTKLFRFIFQVTTDNLNAERLKYNDPMWHDFNISLTVDSSNETIRDWVFFNGKNSVHGKLRMENNNTGYNFTFTDNPGIKLDPSTFSNNYSTLLFDTDYWSFGLTFNTGMICVD